MEPQNWKIAKDVAFTSTLNDFKCLARNAFIEVVKKIFWRNVTFIHYKDIVKNMLERPRLLGCNMGLRLR